MTTLAQQAQKRLSRVNRGQLPYWWRSGMVVSLVVGAVVFGFSALGPTSPPEVEGRLSQFAVQDPARTFPPTGSPGTGAAAPEPPEVPADEALTGPLAGPEAAPVFVDVPSLAGGTVPVSAAAVAAARVAALALFSGDLSAVPLAAGFVPPAGLGAFDNPVVRDLFVHSGGGDLFTFALAVDPDAGGPEPQRALRVTLSFLEGRWVLTGVG